LVNQMLRDLEARRERDQAASSALVAGAVRRPPARAAWLIGGLFAIIAAVALGIWVGARMGETGHHPAVGSSPNAPAPRPARAPEEKAAEIGAALALPFTGEGRKAALQANSLPRVAPDAGAASNPPPDPASGGRKVGDGDAASASVLSLAAAGREGTPEDDSSPTSATAPSRHAGARMTKTPHVPTAAERAAAAYSAAVAAARDGDSNKAEQKFRAALKADPTAYGAREALAALLNREGKANRAMRLLKAGRKADPAHAQRYTRVYARVLVSHSEVQKAIATLEANQPKNGAAPANRAFLAALQERRGDHRAAARNYLKALEARPAKGRWWAGLGVAREQSRKPKKALAAYRRARRAGGLGVTLATWVDKRIGALAP
jgi:MSHA biogenesis protein MshN